jgi:hypothetical protein
VLGVGEELLEQLGQGSAFLPCMLSQEEAGCFQ